MVYIKMEITLTKSAAKQVRSYLKKKPDAIGLRFGVRNSGCSGYAYTIDIADDKAENDEIFNSNGINVLVDKDDLLFVEGTEIDYSGDGLSKTFVFNNPNVAASCGCGESFTTKH